MKTHQRFIATAAIVGAALLSPAEGTVRAAAAAASSVVERNEFGGAAVPVPDDASIPRAPAHADGANMEEVSGRRRLMWWNWMAALGESPSSLPPPLSLSGGTPSVLGLSRAGVVLFVTQIVEILFSLSVTSLSHHSSPTTPPLFLFQLGLTTPVLLDLSVKNVVMKKRQQQLQTVAVAILVQSLPLAVILMSAGLPTVTIPCLPRPLAPPPPP